MTGTAHRLVSALLPLSWPGRAAAVTAAVQVDRRRGAAALDVTLREWSRWRESGALPADRWLADLLLELQAFLAGGLEPRLAGPRPQVLA